MEILPPEDPKPQAPSREECNLAMLCHMLPFVGLLVPQIPIINIIAPLVLWLMKKDSSAFVNEQGKEALNFQITISLALLVCLLTVWLIFPAFLAILIVIVGMILTVIAAIQSSSGKSYRYPFAFRWIK
jgi:uncharacterized Tic20 family protein